MSEPIRVVLADDQRVVREGLQSLLQLLGVDVVASAADGDEAVALAVEHHPDVVLMDLRMPRCDGVEATRQIHAHDPGIKVLVLTTYADDRSVIDALRAGARGYLTKDAGAEEIGQAIERVARGEAALDPVVQQHLIDAVTGAAESPVVVDAPSGLTRREVDVLRCIARGMSNAEIAAQLFVSEATVKSHINHLFAKTGVRDRAQAVTYAYQHGLADDL